MENNPTPNPTQDAELEAFVRSIVTLSPTPGTAGTRSVSWFKTIFERVLGQTFTLGQVRSVMRSCGVRLGKDNDSSTMLARESLRRAPMVWPGRFRINPVTEWLEAVPATDGGNAAEEA